MFTKLTGFLVKVRYGGGPGAAGNVVRESYILCKNEDNLSSVFAKAANSGGRATIFKEFHGDGVDSFFLYD